MKNTCLESKKLTSENLLNAKKIAVIGNQGAGKTTLAITLADIIGIEYVYINYPGDKPIIDKKLLRRDNWIIDGDFGVLDHANAIIILESPLRVCLTRGVKRAFKNFLGWNFWALESYLKIAERLYFLFFWIIEVLQYDKQPLHDNLQHSDILAHIPTVTLKTFEEIELFVENLRKEIHKALCEKNVENRTPFPSSLTAPHPAKID